MSSFTSESREYKTGKVLLNLHYRDTATILAVNKYTGLHMLLQDIRGESEQGI